MATRGRKPKPTAMKELEGNPGKHPLNTSEPKPNKKAPACPKWLEPEAKKECLDSYIQDVAGEKLLPCFCTEGSQHLFYLLRCCQPVPEA